MATIDASQWDLIERAAERLGVKPEAIKKWRQRGSVPHKWRLAIIHETAGAVRPQSLENCRLAREIAA